MSSECQLKTKLARALHLSHQKLPNTVCILYYMCIVFVVFIIIIIAATVLVVKNRFLAFVHVPSRVSVLFHKYLFQMEI